MITPPRNVVVVRRLLFPAALSYRSVVYIVHFRFSPNCLPFIYRFVIVIRIERLSLTACTFVCECDCVCLFACLTDTDHCTFYSTFFCIFRIY